MMMLGGIASPSPFPCVFSALSIVITLVVALPSVVDAYPAVPDIPLAEIMFGPYNKDMVDIMGRGGGGGANLEGVERRTASQFVAGTGENGETVGGENDDFCFISHGCWGGKPPQLSGQQDVSSLISQLLTKSNEDTSSNSEHIRFIVAAGDNFYKHGVRDKYDDRFFTTFESFYDGRNATQRVPWLVALGNHDYYGNWWAQVNYTYATKEQEKYKHLWHHLTTSDVVVSGRWYMPYPYYAIKVSTDMVVVVIDTVLLHRCANSMESCWDGGKQKQIVENWLLHTYANVPYKVVVGHYPVLANGPHENFPWLQEWLIPLMEKSCASVYIHADNHYLQVSKKGYQYYANSGGGAGLRLHFPLKHKSWTKEESIFHAVEYGVMLHCKKDGRITHRVLDRKGKELFRFTSWDENDAPALQQCLARLRAENYNAADTNDSCPLFTFGPLFMIFLVVVLLSMQRRNRIRPRRYA
ncbi:tartrate-resistant acid phosphatase type 5 precursor [Trypanosoma theileri]|uniref:acid phosphatase n=1 Tax=Trypanosoma theileri TaxID=67003 RepID=A0A1X0NS40_9TRYP|nr:tartrate-resistant acid phosphatase type 5 precursor [Trypanosoma theileri]ORC87525.1 tartrate-resistant acid phosphatase type 5 precursor [Trypanosoma theileri]